VQKILQVIGVRPAVSLTLLERLILRQTRIKIRLSERRETSQSATDRQTDRQTWVGGLMYSPRLTNKLQLDFYLTYN